MLRGFVVALLSVGFLLCGADKGEAVVDQKVLLTLKVQGKPLDSTVSGDGKLLFVLGQKGKVFIYSSGGTLEDVLFVEGEPDMINSSPAGDQLFLTDKEAGTVQVVSVEFVQEISIEGSPIKGDPNAPVTIVIFSDFQCPYCGRIVPLLDQVMEQNKGKVKIVFKHFPLVRIHKLAKPAAIVTWAAAKQGKFWQMHDLIFANSSKLTDEKFDEFAKQLELNMEQYQADRLDPNAVKQVEADLRDGGKAGVRGTPTMFINGRKVKNRGLSDIQAVIDAEIEKVNNSKQTEPKTKK